MVNLRKLFTLLVFISLIGWGVAATSPSSKRVFKNLKVLPRRISPDALNDVMNNFRDAMGVECIFCHTRSKDSANVIDYANDENPEKEIARKMMRMTSKINAKYFNTIKDEKFKTSPAVTCITCHHRKATAGEKR
jgi:hypothetical protein